MIIIPRTPDDYARELGVKVRFGWVPDGRWGTYDADLHLITVRRGLGQIQLLCTLMHELGHATYRHRGTSPRQEREADQWAAVRLINKSDFIDAVLTTECSVGMANRLGVLPDVVHHFVKTLSNAERRSIDDLVRSIRSSIAAHIVLYFPWGILT